MKLKRFLGAPALLVAFLFLANSCHRPATPVASNPPPAPTMAAAASAGTPIAPLLSPSGKTYARLHTEKSDNLEPVTIPPVPAGAAPNVDSFNGTARKAAKLSIASGTPQSFSDLGDVLDSLIPDTQMRAKNISKTATSGRIAPEEQRVVTVTAFLYASSKESDNDFHCIVGRDPSKPARYMNVEVSALPPSSSQFFAALRAARNEYKAFFTANGNGLPTSGYDKYNPPIPIKLTGSLFFDVDHVPPAVGPTGMKPLSAWEIHPVSDIQFEQQQ
jgi:hypothetical protein